MKYSLYEIKKKAKEFKVPVDWAVERRKEFLKSEIDFLKGWLGDTVRFLSGSRELEREFIFRIALPDGIEILGDYQNQLKILKNYRAIERKGPGVTQEMVERAREHSIEDILPYPVKLNKTRCPFHDDKRPSMWTKNNFAYCFSCGEGWDSIALVMKLEGLDFKGAVKRLVG